MQSAAQLLDELMGRDRNLAPEEKRSNVRWDHDSVCKYYLCEFCPAELFTNTRSDLGPCEKIHDENLRKQYEKSSRFMKVGYEREFLRYLQNLIAEVERRIRRGHARLALSQSQQAAGIEELGSVGKVEEAQGMMKLVEQLKEEREMLMSTTSTIESFAAQEKQMEVCEVCGAFLIVGDAQCRVDDHLMGKQHMGYAKIKSTVEELKVKLNKRTEEPERDDRFRKEKEEKDRERVEKERKRCREEEEKEKTHDRERRKKSGSRTLHSSRTSDGKSKAQDHRRSRSHDRRRSRSRDRRSHDRAERKHTSHSLERRSKSRDWRSCRHRSKSRERERDRKCNDKEKRTFNEKKKYRNSTIREKRIDVTISESTEIDASDKVNGTGEDIKSEGETQSN
ncbi:luc7-like protein 3 isoform X2 [Ambystoma mexicanum]|uniref:luc7-like protein 3 isoform X2 n=1 Tax=Ambystoma mexicanum TaxID=8296 RepID=UPI0037E731CC